MGAGTTNQRAAANIPFGKGIEPPGGGGGAHATGSNPSRGSSSSGGSNSPRGSASKGGGKDGAGSPTTLSERDQSRLLRAEEPGGTGLLTVGIALAVLLPALLMAVLLRRRPEQPAG